MLVSYYLPGWLVSYKHTTELLVHVAELIVLGVD